MKKSQARSRASGFTYVEVTAAFAVLVLGVMGFAGTVVYTGNLGRTTTQLWRQNVAASGALEDVREDASTQWESLGSTWDGQTVVAGGVSTTSAASLTTTVVDDPAALDASYGMWTDGQPTPNFYLVSVGSSSTGSVGLQTYVADRTGFRSIEAEAYVGAASSTSGGDATSGGTTTTQGGKLDPTPRNVAVSGSARDRVSFQLTNGSSTTVQVKSMQVTLSGGGKFTKVQLAGTTLYDDASKPRNSRNLATPNKKLALPSGPVEVSITGATGIANLLTPIVGQTIKVRLTLVDKSKIEFTVRP